MCLLHSNMGDSNSVPGEEVEEEVAPVGKVAVVRVEAVGVVKGEQR